MTSQEYETYIAELVSQLDFVPGFRIYRNRKYKGTRQPGEYEIDIALEYSIAGKLDFLLIIECKNWNRPVDRPVIQKVAQTRDAISAHKAAVVSLSGFTKEAMSVAGTHGIALWVISGQDWKTISSGRNPPKEELDLYYYRSNLRDELGFDYKNRERFEKYTLIIMDP